MEHLATSDAGRPSRMRDHSVAPGAPPEGRADAGVIDLAAAERATGAHRRPRQHQPS
jgi:hypothetical protein